MWSVTELKNVTKFHQFMLPIRQIRKFVADLYPSTVLMFNRERRKELVDEFACCSTVADCIGFTQRHMGGGACQIPWEIESAINMISEVRPRVMCEIGTFDGGTSLLFSRFLKTLDLFVCIDLYVKNKQMLRLLAPANQKLHFIEKSSHSTSTMSAVAELLGGRKIDALFIDGDHRYEGVKQDFECYRKFVRDGGLILLHDIVEDNGRGRAWAGGVPKLWQEVRSKFPHHEFICEHDQSGFGIGVLTYSGI
jgi:cephalosporin hydroxylase